MLDREAMLTTIENGYAARMRGDKEALDRLWAPDATFRIAGAAMFAEGPADARAAVDALIDQVHFHSIERVATIIEGPRAAVHLSVTLSVGDGPRHVVEVLDIWHFAESGRVQSMVEFSDTALIATLLA